MSDIRLSLRLWGWATLVWSTISTALNRDHLVDENEYCWRCAMASLFWMPDCWVEANPPRTEA